MWLAKITDIEPSTCCSHLPLSPTGLHLAGLSSWGWVTLPPRCNYNRFGYRTAPGSLYAVKFPIYQRQCILSSHLSPQASRIGFYSSEHHLILKPRLDGQYRLMESQKKNGAKSNATPPVIKRPSPADCTYSLNSSWWLVNITNRSRNALLVVIGLQSNISWTGQSMLHTPLVIHPVLPHPKRYHLCF